MIHTSRLYRVTPNPEVLTPKQRRRVRDLLAFVHVTGDKAGGLIAKHVAAMIVNYAVVFDAASSRVFVDSRALSDYDVTNHPFVNFAAILVTRGYRRVDGYTPGRPQKWVKFERVDTDSKRNTVTLCNITSSVYITGTHPPGTFELTRGYAEQVGCTCYEKFSEVEGAVA